MEKHVNGMGNVELWFLDWYEIKVLKFCNSGKIWNPKNKLTLTTLFVLFSVKHQIMYHLNEIIVLVSTMYVVCLWMVHLKLY
jgi:hypothetical protein